MSWLTAGRLRTWRCGTWCSRAFGPPLWNIYYADARAPVRKNGFQEVVYADDLNAFKAFDHSTLAEDLHSDMEQCQKDLHTWGRANQVEFDASKESKHVLATCGRGSGGPFTFLGVSFDEGLTMAGALHSLVHEASWKLASILRTSRYFSTPELIGLYKSKLLSYIEYRTPAIYHACTSHLAPLDQIQRRFFA